MTKRRPWIGFAGVCAACLLAVLACAGDIDSGDEVSVGGSASAGRGGSGMAGTGQAGSAQGGSGQGGSGQSGTGQGGSGLGGGLAGSGSGSAGLGGEGVGGSNQLPPLSFESDVWPILRRECALCHGDQSRPLAGPDPRASYEYALEVVPRGNNGVEMPVYLGILIRTEEGTMPPQCGGPPACVPKEDITVIGRWISSGNPPPP